MKRNAKENNTIQTNYFEFVRKHANENYIQLILSVPHYDYIDFCFVRRRGRLVDFVYSLAFILIFRPR